MFYSLSGKIVHKNLSGVAIDCNGIAFFCQCSELTSTTLDVGSNATVYSYMNVREGAVDLFGFATETELEWFKLLTTVSGVGPKAALAILSVYAPSKLALCISAGDYKAITKANGVGPKIAQRIVNELKSKVASVSGEGGEEILNINSVSEGSNKSEAVAALTMLGYSQTEASVAIGRFDDSLSVEDLIKLGLKQLSSFK